MYLSNRKHCPCIFYILVETRMEVRDKRVLAIAWEHKHEVRVRQREIIYLYIIIRVRSAFSLVASCVLLKYTRTDDVN